MNNVLKNFNKYFLSLNNSKLYNKVQNQQSLKNHFDLNLDKKLSTFYNKSRSILFIDSLFYQNQSIGTLQRSKQMHDNDEQVKDKSITNECRQDFSQVKFLLKKIVLSPRVIDILSDNVKKCLIEREYKNFELKLQFICTESNTRLKQIIIKDSNKHVKVKDESITIQIPQSQSPLVKIMYYYEKQNTQVLVNIYFKSLNSDKNKTSLFQYIGCVYLNLEEINKKLKERIKYFAIHKMEVLPYFKKINLICQNEKQINKYKNVRNFSQFYQKNQLSEFKNSQFKQEYKPKQIWTKNISYLQIRIFHSQNLSQIIQFFRLKKQKFSNPIVRKSNLKIQTRVVNQNIANNFVSHQILRNKFHFYQNQYNLQSTRSQFALRTFQNQNVENYQKINQNRFNSQKKTFQQKIYELLQQVKSTKKIFETQNYQNIKNSQSIKFKNIYCMTSPRSNQQLIQNRIKQQDYEVNQSFQCNVVNSIMPVTTFPSIRHSKSEQYLSSNRNQVIKSKQRYQNLYRIQKRLESHSKIATISTRFLHRMYLDQNPQ